MKKKLVISGWDIRMKIQELLTNPKTIDYRQTKFLLLPDGIDKLEEMITDYRKEHGKLSYDEIELMFNEFRKEQGII